MALREANKISQHLKKNITFSRDEITVNGKTESKVRLNDIKKGMTTLWTIDKFESRLDLMRDLYQQDENCQSSDDDPFYDPDDQWDKDFKLGSPHNRRISTMGALSLASRKTTTDNTDNKARAESIFAKYRGRQDSSASSTPENTDIPSSTPEGKVFDSPTNLSPLLSRNVEQPMTSSRVQSRGSSCDQNHVRVVSVLCAEVLGKSLSSLQEDRDKLKEPIHEKVLSSAQRIKACLANIRKHQKSISDSCYHQALFPTEEKMIQENCISLTVSMETLIAHVQSWECSNHGDDYKKFAVLGEKLDDLVQELSSLIITLLSDMGESSNSSNPEENLSECNSLLKDIVKQTAKMAVLTMDETTHSEKKYISSRDGELEEAFEAGQEQFLQSSIRHSLDTLENIQEQIDENIIRVDVSEVEREVTEEVVKLLRATSDFIHQGREIQFQLQSAVKEDTNYRRSNGRFPFVVRLVRGLDTILDLTKSLATTTPQACDDMDLHNIIAYPEQIATATETIARSCRAYIHSEFNGISHGRREEISNEQEYLEKKVEDVHSTALGLKNVLKRFMFLKPHGSENGTRTDLCGTPYSRYNGKSSQKDEQKTPLRRRFCKESPI